MLYPDEGSVPSTPRKAIPDTFASPQLKSPAKRGLIGISPLRRTLLPTKTPNGRAGSLSPARRSLADQSAQKKAVLSGSFYDRLKAALNENEDYLDRQVKEQEMKFADIVAGRNRGSGTWPEVNYEEDVSLDTPRTRRRRRKVVVERTQLSSSEDDVGGDAFEDSDDEYMPKRARKQGNKVMNNDEDEDDFEEDDLEVEDDDNNLVDEVSSLKEEILHKKRGRKPKKKAVTEIGSPFRSKGGPQDDSPKKMGRPPKSEIIALKIESIFYDPKTQRPSNTIHSVDINSLLGSLYETGIPTISGIKRDVSDEFDTRQKSFVPMPLPKVDSEGNIIDQEYLDKYFSNRPVNSQLAEKIGDEKAFYMDGSEGYFEQHSIRVRPSSNSISQLAPDIDYDEFSALVAESNKIAKNEKLALGFARKSLYNQWCFELEQGFNINFYGVGSKMNTIMDFVTGHLLDKVEQIYDGSEAPRVLVVNGFNPTLKLKKVVQDILSCFVPKDSSEKYPKHISDTVSYLIGCVTKQRKTTNPTTTNNQPKLILVIHNVDGERLRDDKSQDLLSQVCAIPEIWTITSTDNINVSVLWDLYKTKNFNFIWHDLTTFEPYINEMSFKDVLSMGRSKKFVGNKGAKFVLSSLTDNQRDVYRIMLRHQIEKILVGTNKQARNGLRGSIKFGIPFKVLYDSCVEDFVVSNEVNLRSMVGEFVEHKMAKLTKDETGTEIVFIPFNFDEMERVLQAEFNESIGKEDL
ncbi:Origin recognition complex subunit 2 [Scheffersomyces spartinae]|uniref:Origin recognition complex subunit 2 n=1 Tax=Scheffersomyces spartinae TaxID=45513 RepID=A0A9P8AIN5_9ASCO|nr:Origin recognition complex subunit 2 [Scheffersomyces spartinae]KAG7193921.1 Origin recognition complex subunit 2 [Scheffersomyces spartinae]